MVRCGVMMDEIGGGVLVPWCTTLVESYYLANRINPSKSSLLGLATHKDKSSKSLQNCNIKSQTKSRDFTPNPYHQLFDSFQIEIRADHVRPISNLTEYKIGSQFKDSVININDAANIYGFYHRKRI